jgi:penicillin-binding protein 2
MLTSALQMEDVVVIRPAAVPDGSEDEIFKRIALMFGYDPEVQQGEFTRWRARWSDRLIDVASVSLDDAARFRSAAAELPGVQVMNEVDYLVGNIWAPHLPVTIKTNVPREVALKLEANSMYMPGVTVDDAGLSRHYPGGEIMSHALGYVRMIDGVSLDDLRNRDESNQRIYDQNDTIGKEGLEQALEARLRGRKGRRSVEVDAAGVIMRTVPGSEAEPVEGDSVYLTIDLEFQRAVGEALRKGIAAAAAAKEKVNVTRTSKNLEPWQTPNSGAAVVTDPRTGEVLAMISYPHYDNQLFVSGISSRKWDEYTTSDQGNAFLNRAIQEVYPPGSTFKIFLAASALHQGTLTPEQRHSCAGAINVPTEENLADGLKMACWIGWQGNQHGSLNLYEAIAQSCDTYFYNVAVARTTLNQSQGDAYYFDWGLLAGEVVSSERHVFDGLGIDPLADDMKNRFWFGKATEVEIQGEAVGLFPDREWKLEALDGEGWTVGDTLNVSIGQYEVKVTPLQLAMNVSALGTGGKIRQPHLVNRWLLPNGEETTVEPVDLSDLGIAQEHLDAVVEGMVATVHDPVVGTAHHNWVDDVKVTKWPLTNPTSEIEAGKIEEMIFAGKTGTANMANRTRSAPSRPARVIRMPGSPVSRRLLNPR